MPRLFKALATSRSSGPKALSAMDRARRYSRSASLFAPDAVDRHQVAQGLGPDALEVLARIRGDRLHDRDRAAGRRLGLVVGAPVLEDSRQGVEDVGEVRMVRPDGPFQEP